MCYETILRDALAAGVEESMAGGQVLFCQGDPGWSGHLPDAPAAVPRGPAEATALTLTLAKSDAAPRRSWRIVSPSSLEGKGETDVADLLALEPAVNRLRGSVVHAWFQEVAWLDDSAAVPGDEQLQKIARQQPEADGLSAEWLRDLAGQFRAMLQRPAVCTALTRPRLADNESCELWRERTFAVVLDGQLVRGCFDRVVIRRRDEQVTEAMILDYKTDAVSAATLEATVARYRPQMEAYRRALEAMLKLPTAVVRARLLFVGCGESREV